MISEFSETNLERLLTFSNGRTSPERTDAGLNPVYGSNGIIGYTDNTNAQSQTIVVGRVGSYCGSLYFSKSDCWITDNAISARAKADNDTRFLYYLLTTLGLNSWRGGSGQPLLNQRILNGIEVAAPKPHTQKAIAKILGDLDDKIDLLREMNRTLEEVARAVFRAWFVDFEPVQAKAAGATSFRGMPQDLFDTIPDSFEPSDIGDIPQGWTVGNIGDVIRLDRTSVKPFENPDQEYQHFSLPAFDRDQEADIELGSSIKSGKYVVQESSILFSKLNPRIPRIWLPRSPSTDYPQIASTEFLVCVANDSWSRSYAYFLMSQPPFIEGLTKQATGTSNSHQRVKPDQFKAVQIPIPPETMRQLFDEFGHHVLEQVIRNREECGTLVALRNILLPKLISGELEAPSLEALGLEGGG